MNRQKIEAITMVITPMALIALLLSPIEARLLIGSKTIEGYGIRVAVKMTRSFDNVR